MSNLALVGYERVELERLRQAISAARRRLAELQTKYTVEKAKADSMQARLFERLENHYRRRDNLRLIVDNRKRFLVTILREDVAGGEQIKREYEQKKAQIEQEYEETLKTFATKRPLTLEQEAEIHKLWKKLVNLYHPDRFVKAPDKLETYGKLTAAINRARDGGDIETLTKIAADPDGFISRQGWAMIDFRDEEDRTRLEKLRENLEREILRIVNASKEFYGSSEFELYKLAAKSPKEFDGLVAQQTKDLDDEIAGLQREADYLADEIERLTGRAVPVGCFA